MKSLIVLSILLIPACGLAQGTSVGEASLKFLFPARVLGLAEATVADTSNVGTSFANPACLAFGNSLEVSFSQMQWIQDIQSQILNSSLPIWGGTAAFTISSTNVADIPVREVPGPPLGSFTAHSTSFQLGYGINVSSVVSVGATAKYLYDKLYTDEASGYGLDLGMIYRVPFKGLSLAAVLTNLGRMSAFRSQSTDLPTKVDVGADYSFSVVGLDFVGALAVGKETMSGGTNQVRIGAEATYDNLLSVRAGYQTGYDVRGLTAGLGIHYSLIQLDYAYIPFSQGFGDASVITIGVKF